MVDAGDQRLEGELCRLPGRKLAGEQAPQEVRSPPLGFPPGTGILPLGRDLRILALDVASALGSVPVRVGADPDGRGVPRVHRCRVARLAGVGLDGDVDAVPSERPALGLGESCFPATVEPSALGPGHDGQAGGGQALLGLGPGGLPLVSVQFGIDGLAQASPVAGRLGEYPLQAIGQVVELREGLGVLQGDSARIKGVAGGLR